jgi:uncharacterized membrane protein YphA (DoxX/SURF4 family)
MASTVWRDAGLTAARLLAGGALALAGVLKATRDPKVFALSVDAFGILPAGLVPAVAHFLPWFEILVGMALVLGWWSRQAALLVAGTYLVFTVAVAGVVVQGRSIDCGCFAGLFGSGAVGWQTVGRNAVFLAASAVVLVMGGGGWSAEALMARRQRR